MKNFYVFFLKPSENDSLDFFDKVSRKTSFLTNDFSIYTYSADLSYPEKNALNYWLKTRFPHKLGRAEAKKNEDKTCLKFYQNEYGEDFGAKLGPKKINQKRIFLTFVVDKNYAKTTESMLDKFISN